jgi:Zn-dependent peptidase ImmA (M78 family)
MSGGLKIPITPRVLKWARESAGLTVEFVSKDLEVDQKILEGWEKNLDKPNLSNTERLCFLYKRSLACFMLPDVPNEPGPPRDMRLMFGASGKFDKKTLLVFRKAHLLQEYTNELLENLNLPNVPLIPKVTLRDDPEKIAIQVREKLGISLEVQTKKWKDWQQAFEGWRKAVETLNVFVFRFKMPIEDARGFSLKEPNPNVIVVNSGDGWYARNFTLFHEFAHLMLNESSVCIPKITNKASGQIFEIEKWCNQFSAALLLPKVVFSNNQDVLNLVETADINLLKSLSKTFKVSCYVFLIRLENLGMISFPKCQKMLGDYEKTTKKSKGGGRNPGQAASCIGKLGKKYVSLVVDSKSSNKINNKQMSDYLSLSPKYFSDLISISG